ncbi:ABC transporter ATP-binding protein [Endozoicomonas sp. SM1973]|uniref:ABC transporter ATP-binding protein n=1 Tax=Spartinivicinus marinus TaxID=2994442 RepID=A0A853II54_9GAMM|nr:ABC transporter ATP-binding protein [Spartinivicinus marinus]MCX4028674.1 ABC transporter ATP-binding protein [Spartinivicinus marinus]NYZ69087.1 ABC transporter ATP-binding protein [Spartinivicinus marinus]
MEPPLLALDDVHSGYNHHTIVHQISFHINPGDICSLLGPSGCGKTTTLRAIAGFESVSQGSIKLADTLLSSPKKSIPPEQRKIGMVFQDYALFPHLTVAKNIAFGLPKQASKAATIETLLKLVNLTGYEERYPHELSGGQQQRVALARALAPAPKLLLMDEPFSNLDVDLRRRLSEEVREILKSQGISAILVTHDQEEAFSFSDKVGVMKDGKLLQWDTPYNLYHEPRSHFVANFIGQGHFIRGNAISPESVATELGELTGNRSYNWVVGTPIEVLLRPDDVIEAPDSPIKAEVVQKVFKGAMTHYHLRLPTGSIVESLIPSHHNYEVGEQIGIKVEADHLVAFSSPTDGNKPSVPL